ncbi:MAG: hypothetical protein WC785_01420 [Tatlockia sp.]|jgi:hypothetical protein
MRERTYSNKAQCQCLEYLDQYLHIEDWANKKYVPCGTLFSLAIGSENEEFLSFLLNLPEYYNERLSQETLIARLEYDLASTSLVMDVVCKYLPYDKKEDFFKHIVVELIKRNLNQNTQYLDVLCKKIPLSYRTDVLLECDPEGRLHKMPNARLESALKTLHSITPQDEACTLR